MLHMDPEFFNDTVNINLQSQLLIQKCSKFHVPNKLYRSMLFAIKATKEFAEINGAFRPNYHHKIIVRKFKSKIFDITTD